MELKEMINELRILEQMGTSLAERCYKARKQLERFAAPAPAKGLTPKQESDLLSKRRKHKKAPATTRAIS